MPRMGDRRFIFQGSYFKQAAADPASPVCRRRPLQGERTLHAVSGNRGVRHLPPECGERAELPASHTQEQGVALPVFRAQFLVGLVLLRKVLRHALHALQK